jgi:hypothetical protein
MSERLKPCIQWCMGDGDFANQWWFVAQIFLAVMESAALFLFFCPVSKTNFARSQR